MTSNSSISSDDSYVRPVQSQPRSSSSAAQQPDQKHDILLSGCGNQKEFLIVHLDSNACYPLIKLCVFTYYLK
uniref:Uncharacterized protein n=1 Tax=Strigamia maritima TaxID=126957 RepID=T1JGA2_STRMM